MWKTLPLILTNFKIQMLNSLSGAVQIFFTGTLKFQSQKTFRTTVQRNKPVCSGSGSVQTLVYSNTYKNPSEIIKKISKLKKNQYVIQCSLSEISFNSKKRSCPKTYPNNVSARQHHWEVSWNWNWPNK